MNKKQMRKEMLLHRKNMSDTEVAKKSAQIIEQIMKDADFAKATTIMAYMPVNQEVDVRPLIEYALSKGKRVVLPVTKGLEMYPVRLKSMNELIPGEYGIPIPSSNERIPVNEIEYIIVPGVAYDETGGRIGYGGGYYDRFLPWTSAITCGVCYEFQIVARIESDETDVKVHKVVSE